MGNDCCNNAVKKELKRIALEIALNVTDKNIEGLIELDKSLIWQNTSHPYRFGTPYHIHGSDGKISSLQVKTLFRMGAAIEDREHPKKSKYCGMGGQYTTYFKLSELGKYILKNAAPWYKMERSVINE